MIKNNALLINVIAGCLALPLMGHAYSLSSSSVQLAEKWAAADVGTVELLQSPPFKQKLAQLDQQAQHDWRSMQTNAQTGELWADLPLSDPSLQAKWGDNIWHSLQRLKTMAVAYRVPGQYYQNAQLLQTILQGMDRLSQDHYYAGLPEYGNWWPWEIGSPKVINDIFALLYPHFSVQARDRWMAASRYYAPDAQKNGASPSARYSSNPKLRAATGGNLTDMVQIILMRGVLSDSETEIKAALTALPQVLTPVKSGDGFYADGSFIQHDDIPYTGTYGTVLLEGVGKVMNVIAGSKWQAQATPLMAIYPLLNHAFMPFFYQGRMLDMMNGRAVSRSARQNLGEGMATLTTMSRFLDAASPDDYQQLARFIKTEVLAQDPSQFLAQQSDYTVYQHVKQLLDDKSIPVDSSSSKAFFYPSMDRFVQHQSDYTFGLALHSYRIGNFECMNDENRHGWFTGDGAMYLYEGKGKQYSDYWPIINPYYIAGTTEDVTQILSDCTNASQTAERNGARRNQHMHWVGGVTDGKHSGLGMDFYNYDDSLQAKKSWFVFDHQIVVLGAGLQSRVNHPFTTVVTQMKYDKYMPYRIEIDRHPITKLTKQTQPMQRLWIDDPVSQSRDGYWFPEPTKVQVRMQHVQSDWSTIGTDQHSISGDTLMAILPQDNHTDHYAYVVFPALSSAQFAQRVAQPTIHIEHNTPFFQAVTFTPDHILAANVWGGQREVIGAIRVSQASAWLVQQQEHVQQVTVSDPTQAQAVLTFTLETGWQLDPKTSLSALHCQGQQCQLATKQAAGQAYHFTLIQHGLTKSTSMNKTVRANKKTL